MAKQLQLRRGTTAQHSSFTGQVGELTIDTDKDTAVVHDYATAGGIPLLREDLNNIAGGSITASMLSTNSGSYGQTLQVNNAGTGIEMGESGLVSCQFFNSSGTYTKPAGIKRIRVQLVGGGGGGSGYAESGGSGGYSEEIIDATSITTVSVTVGGGGGGVTYSGAAGNGGATSFGSYLSATGGHGANRQGSHSGGAPGVGSGGSFNLFGGGGGGHDGNASHPGAASYFGGGNLGAHTGQTGYPGSHEGHGAPGSGGTGSYTNHTRGANGLAGCVVVWEYA